MAIIADVSLPNGLKIAGAYVRPTFVSINKQTPTATEDDPEPVPVQMLHFHAEAYASQAARDEGLAPVGTLGQYLEPYLGGDVFEQAYAALAVDYPDAEALK